MSKRNGQFILLPLAMTILLSACAHKTSVIARVNPLYSPTFTSRIALADKKVQPIRDYQFERAVIIELERHGVKPVPVKESEYTLGYWIEENWENGPDRTVWVPTRPIVDPRATAYGFPSRPDLEPPVHYPNRNVRYAQGIRLRLFVTHPKDTNRVETAWEGYVGGDPQLSPEQYGPLLRTLLDYFGESYTSRVKLAE